MVNPGHPSRACDPCKARHTKCDERRPRCSRCQRAGRECTGYKNDFDIKLRNETHVVTRRMRAREHYLQTHQMAVTAPYEQQAVALFLDDFVMESPDPRSAKGFLGGLLPLLRSAKPDSLIWDTVKAVGLCFVAKRMTNESLNSRAIRSYLLSLNRLQKTLNHDVDCMSTDTMMSVYLMGLYEMMMPPKKTLHPWLAHLQGLMSIMKARNQKTGFFSPGIAFFSAEDTSLDSAWAIIQDTPVDRWFMDNVDHSGRLPYGEFSIEYALKPQPGAQGSSSSGSLDDLILRTQPIVQAAPLLFESSHPEAKTNVERHLIAARSQLSSFRDWPSKMPEHWHAKPIHHDMESSGLSRLGIFPGRVDVYPSLYVAAMWSTYRTTLLRLCDVIAQCGQYLETATEPFAESEEYKTLRTIAREVSEDICSSVAYHIYSDWVNRFTTGSFQRCPKALGGLLLIWPLFAGSVLSIVPEENRAWMRHKLRSIGVSTGLAQAVVLADTVDLGRRTDPLKPLIIAQGHLFMWIASTL